MANSIKNKDFTKICILLLSLLKNGFQAEQGEIKGIKQTPTREQEEIKIK